VNVQNNLPDLIKQGTRRIPPFGTIVNVIL
jgi:hypothetical protein